MEAEAGVAEGASEGEGRQLGLGWWERAPEQAQEGGVGSQWELGRVGSVGPVESTLAVAGGTQGSFGGFEQGSDMEKAMFRQ